MAPGLQSDSRSGFFFLLIGRRWTASISFFSPPGAAAAQRNPRRCGPCCHSGCPRRPWSGSPSVRFAASRAPSAGLSTGRSRRQEQETYAIANIVLLVGNLGADPELRSASSGIDIASFTLGTSRLKRDSEGKTYKDESGFTAKDTEWHRVTCFNALGRIVAQHATKGMLVSVRGRLHYTRWTDRENVERYGCEIIGDDVQFLGRSARSGAAEAPEPQLELEDDLAA
jgi:single-strand DNA-binding protein